MSKSRSCDPFTIPLDLILHYIVQVPQWPICLPNLQFLASTDPETWRGSQNSKSRPRDPFTTPFDLILHFVCLEPLMASLHNKFEVSSFNRSRDMEGVPKFTHTLTHSLTDTQTDFIICPMLLTHWADNNLIHKQQPCHCRCYRLSSTEG